ncbi:MAG: hypothetical protein AUJ04_03325 [Acidobacteria bacterium 13_1_40CM_3_55_6]|nr:MAG: hypothetical protein AUJ04_03325 [Acidobacteria bacterium 13_1_40CM_3_55_6]
MLIATIGLTFTTKAACSESIKPARQIAHVAAPAKKAKASETKTDFQENVFKVQGTSRVIEAEMSPIRDERDYTLMVSV